MTALGLVVGGGLGALARYGLTGIISRRQIGLFPAGTLAVNVAGSLALGIVVGLVSAGRISDFWLTWAGTGFLGAFTTFSTFTFETAQLAGERAWRFAAANVILSVGLSIGAAAAGYLVAS